MTGKGGERYWFPELPHEITAAQTAISEGLAQAGVTGEEALRIVGDLLEAHSLPRSSPAATVPRSKVSKAALVRFLKDTASKQITRGELFERAKAHFADSHHVSDRDFRAAYRQVPQEQRRERGETNRTLNRKK